MARAYGQACVRATGVRRTASTGAKTRRQSYSPVSLILKASDDELDGYAHIRCTHAGCTKSVYLCNDYAKAGEQRDAWVIQPAEVWKGPVYYVSRPSGRQSDSNPKSVNVDWCLNQVQSCPSPMCHWKSSPHQPSAHMASVSWNAMRCRHTTPCHSIILTQYCRALHVCALATGLTDT